MKLFLLSCSMIFLVASADSTRAESRAFTNAEGKKIMADLVAVRDGKAVLRRARDLKIFSVAIEKLSEDDKKFITEWKEKRDAGAEEVNKHTRKDKSAIERREKIVAFCNEKKGAQVGNGECWTLANEAFKVSGTKRPGGELRVWGRLLDLEKESVQPGDVVECRMAKIKGYGTTAVEHTAVIVKGGRRKSMTIAQQNWAGDKTVHQMEVDLGKLVSGEVMVYRPE